MSLLNGIGSLGAGLSAFGGTALKDAEDQGTQSRPLLNSTPAVASSVAAAPSSPDTPAAVLPVVRAAAPLTGAGVALGMRQNNPGNLAFAGQPNASPGNGNRFASFPDMASGVAAMANQLVINQAQHGVTTVRQQVERWVSDPKADLTTYIDDTAKALGVHPDQPVDWSDPKVQAAFIQAQQPHESGGGGAALDPADVRKGVELAAAMRNA